MCIACDLLVMDCGMSHPLHYTVFFFTNVLYVVMLPHSLHHKCCRSSTRKHTHVRTPTLSLSFDSRTRSRTHTHTSIHWHIHEHSPANIHAKKTIHTHAHTHARTNTPIHTHTHASNHTHRRNHFGILDPSHSIGRQIYMCCVSICTGVLETARRRENWSHGRPCQE